MSQVKLVTQYGNRGCHSRKGSVPHFWNGHPVTFRMLRFVCSTGGPGAFAKVLAGLGPAFPLPILLIEHMTARFIAAFASWLGVVCPLPVIVAQDESEPVAGPAIAARVLELVSCEHL
jgi:two-component system chemotaxis response regulator CheB